MVNILIFISKFLIYKYLTFEYLNYLGLVNRNNHKFLLQIFKRSLTNISGRLKITKVDYFKPFRYYVIYSKTLENYPLI